MFNKKKSQSICTLIGDGTRIDGELHFSGGLRIDGEVHGDVEAIGDGPNLLIISEKARVIGKVSGGHVIINGVVNGPVRSRDLLELQPKAVIVGDVRYEILEFHQGATIDGELRPIGAAAKPDLQLATLNLELLASTGS